jgi:Cutinase/Putative Ig domain
VAALATTLTAPAVSAAPSAPGVAATTGCADVLFVGARGSGNAGPGTPGWVKTAADPLGLGGTVLAAYKRLVGQLGSRRSVETVSVNFPAASVWDIARGHPDKYFAGLEQGVSFTDQLLIGHAAKCPDQRIVLAGYSQGAMVMHREVQTLITLPNGARAGILGRLDAAVLFGDGDRVPYDSTVNYGNFHPGRRGIGLLARALSGSGTALFGSTGSYVQQVCLRNDPVCDSNAWPTDNIYWSQHFDYPGSQVLRDATDDAAREVLSVPLPQPRVVELQPQAGTAFSYQLRANIASGYRLQWQLAPGATLPAGLSLTAAGRVFGVPTATPSGTTPIRVRGIILGQPGRWANATLAWNAATPAAPPTDPRAPTDLAVIPSDSNGCCAAAVTSNAEAGTDTLSYIVRRQADGVYRYEAGQVSFHNQQPGRIDRLFFVLGNDINRQGTTQHYCVTMVAYPPMSQPSNTVCIAVAYPPAGDSSFEHVTIEPAQSIDWAAVVSANPPTYR